MNKATIMGNLGADVELRETRNGTPVCNLRVATNQYFKAKDGSSSSRTDWHRVVVFGPNAENCSKFLHKGSKVLVEGSLQTRDYEDRDGVKRQVTEIKANSVNFLSPRSQTDDTNTSQPDDDYPL